MVLRLSLIPLLVVVAARISFAIAPPGPPQTLIATVSGNTVSLSWLAPATGDVPSSYTVEAALSPGGAVIASLPVSATSLVVPNVPNGVYYARVRAQNADGTSPPSNEATIVVPAGSGGCSAPPNAPQGLSGTAAGSVVTLNWGPPVGGCAATAYAVHAGSASGLSNITVANVGAATTLAASAPVGTYYIRVVSLNAFGGSAPSNEVVITVGVAQPPSPPPQTGQFAVSTTASIGWTSIQISANGAVIGTLTRYFEPGAAASCVAVAGARVVTIVAPGTVTYSARSDTGVVWSGTGNVTAGGCHEVQLVCANRDCTAGAPAPPPPPSPPTSVFHVWGGSGYTQYLGYFGCTFCKEFGTDSINNEFGTYGSRFSPTSVRNAFSQYGSRFNSNSACNEFATSPPRVFNASRSVFYGELTVNRFRPNAIGNLSSWLLLDVCSN